MTRKNTFATLALVLSQMLSLGYIYGAEKPTVIKKADLPALKGGKVAKNSDGIPSCTTGRAKIDGATMEEWSVSHQSHVCAVAKTMYVCRAGKNLSVRCE